MPYQPQGWLRPRRFAIGDSRQSSAERRKTLKSGREVVFSESADRLLCVLLQREHGGQIMAVGEAYITMQPAAPAATHTHTHTHTHTPGSRHYRIHADSIRSLRRAAQILLLFSLTEHTRTRAHLHNNFINN
jgi:Rps23 Pro-64 3,4-dihydroxylase Tpa1-like proline 4-hydroxylase